MDINIGEIAAAIVDAVGGEVFISAEALERGFQDKVITLDYDFKMDRFRVALADADDIEYEDEE